MIPVGYGWALILNTYLGWNHYLIFRKHAGIPKCNLTINSIIGNYIQKMSPYLKEIPCNQIPNKNNKY